MIQFQLAKYYRQNFRSINMSQKIIKIIRTHVDKLWLAKASHMIFLRKLFQSTRLYIEEIVRRLASKCAWQIMRFWYQSYERMLMNSNLIQLFNVYCCLELEDYHWDTSEGQPDSIKICEITEAQTVSVDAVFSLLWCNGANKI